MKLQPELSDQKLRQLSVIEMASALCKASAARAGARVPGVTPEQLHAVGRCLHEIASGADARVVFEQSKRRRGHPRKSENELIALQYYARLLDNLEDAAGAASVTAAEFGVAASTVRRIARMHRDLTLRMLEGLEDVAALRTYLKRKSKGGNRPR